jgi:hypothetical protein
MFVPYLQSVVPDITSFAAVQGRKLGNGLFGTNSVEALNVICEAV